MLTYANVDSSALFLDDLLRSDYQIPVLIP
jgi:hypothetical protein